MWEANAYYTQHSSPIRLMPLPHLDAQTLADLLDLEELSAFIPTAFRGAEAPARQHLETSVGTLLIMPAWGLEGYAGTKLVTLQHANRARGLPTIHGTYLLFEPETGRPLCTMDGGMLTVLRTAATSAAAAAALANSADTLLVVGTGRLAPWMARAHARVMGCREVLVWGRHPDRAEGLAHALREEGFDARPAESLPAGLRGANMITVATSSSSPLLTDEMVVDGVHLDLVGAYRSDMAEASPAWFTDARVFVDTWEGARSEAGDVIQAVEAGVLTWQSVAGSLEELFANGNSPAKPPGEASRTIFKSVGASQEDLAAAVLAWTRYSA